MRAVRAVRVGLLIVWIAAGLLPALAAAVPEREDGKPGAVSSGRRSAVAAVDSVDSLILLEKSTRSLPPVEASPDEGAIARLTAHILSQYHYRRQPLDDDVSSRFLDRYLDSLDGLRMHFLETDVAEFAVYRDQLDDLTKKGDTKPARMIFERFLERLDERVTYVAELLKTQKFEFTGQDRYRIDRRHAPRPKDLDEAHELWRQHLRYEVLQERLAKKKTKPGEKAAPSTSAQEPAPDAVLSANGLSEEIIKTLTRRYARTLRTLRDFDGADIFQVYLTALTHVYDPHSDYMGKASLDNFAINMNLSLFGIGAVLQSEDGYCKVRELRPGPAMRSKKVKPGDRIVAVAQGDGEPVDVVDMKLNKVVELIRGPKGSRVRLTLIPVDATDPSERREVLLVRDEIKLEDEEAKAKIIDLPGLNGASVRVGLIDLPSFYATMDLGTRHSRGRSKSTSFDLERLLIKLKQENVAGVILDLRRNGGGSLEEAIKVTGLFIKKGPVVQVKDSSDDPIIEEDEDNSIAWDGPLVVLTSRFSASASEIVAGALQDYGRALIVGDVSTHGKGTVQQLIQLQPRIRQLVPDSTNNPGALKITVRKFYRASGGSTQLKGVTPDIVFPSVNNYAEVGEGSLDDPLAWDTIPSAPFDPVNVVGSYLPELRRRSEERVARDQDFAYIREDIEQYRKHQADKSVSLNEAERRRESSDNEARLESRKAERKARPEPTETTYEITLKQVDLPGLPPPSKGTNEVNNAESSRMVLRTDDESPEPDEDKSAQVDAGLREGKRIMLDLIELSHGGDGLTAK